MRRLIGACAAAVAGVGLAAACSHEVAGPLVSKSCVPTLSVAPVESAALPVLGRGAISGRYTAEVDARGSVAYTTTWGSRSGTVGNAIYIWNVAGDVPVLVDSVLVSGATTLGDVAVSDDGALLVVATERSGGSIVVFDLSNPVAPQQLSRFSNSETSPGVHTSEIGRVGGKLYAFLSIDPIPARLVVVDLSNPSAPQQVYSKQIGQPYVHDVFLRDGLLFLAIWNGGMEIWDLGGAGNGSPSAPRVISSIATVGGSAHNIWWFHDPASGSKAYAFVGEEGPAQTGFSSSGDIHVVDLCDMANPKEVAFYHVPGAGAHNFSMDESRGILYAAYYNGGVRAIDVRGDLSACTAAQKSADGRCDLRLMGREVATGVADQPGRFIWGVVYRNGVLYASDMLNGLWKIKAVGAP
jgi:hypothetical protein